MTPSATQPRKPSLSFFCLLAGLSIPAIIVFVWDAAPRYQAVRELKKNGIALAPASLHAAVEQGDLETLRLLHTARVAVEGVDNQGRSLLVRAIQAKRSEVIPYLLEKTPDAVHPIDGTRTSLLAHAIAAGDLDAIRPILERTIDPNLLVDVGGEMAHPLHKAAREQNLPLMVMLLAHPRLDVDHQDEDGMTALHHAVRQRKTEALQTLLSAPRSPNPLLRDARDETPIADAVRHRRADAVRLLVHHGALPEGDELSDLMTIAIDNRDPESLRHLLSNIEDPKQTVVSPDAPLLEYAFDAGAAGCAYELLAAGADSEACLRKAVQCGDGLMASLIVTQRLNAGAPPAPVTGNLLEPALYGGNPDCIDLLLQHGADPDQMTSTGQRILALALATRAEHMVTALLEAGAEPEFRLEHPVSTSFSSFFWGDGKTRWYLKHDKGLSPLMLACLTEQEAAAKRLLQRGADRTSYSEIFKRYPIAFAAERRNARIMQMVLGRKAGDETRKILVSLDNQRATFYRDNEAIMSFGVSTGRKGFATPKGRYVITNKYRNWNSTIYGSSMPFFMRLNCGDIGLHSGSVPGYPASHGCVRLPWAKAKQLYSLLELGDLVVIDQ